MSFTEGEGGGHRINEVTRLCSHGDSDAKGVAKRERRCPPGEVRLLQEFKLYSCPVDVYENCLASRNQITQEPAALSWIIQLTRGR